MKRLPADPAAPPPSRPPRATASAVNPEAGDHAIVADPVEWGAAQAAARRSWERFPYYERRWGERGWRFSLSDSGWIATLTALPSTAVPGQIAWLQDLLVPRGMPSWLLEWHLGALHAELVAGTPAALARYAVLANAASLLHGERTRALPDATFDALAAEFDDAVAALPEAFARMGGVLVGAVVDEANGRAGAIAAVTDWARDRERFPSVWCAAVDTCVHRARASVRRR